MAHHDALLILSQRLTLRTLSALDVPSDTSAPAWYGQPERRGHVWEPPIPSGKYLRALVAACDQKERFAFLVSEAKGSTPIGFLKAQLLQVDAGALVVPTIVVGDPERDGQRLGSEAVGMFNWFALTELAATGISLRFYEDNAVTLRLAEAHGYHLVRTETERTAAASRTVLVYEISGADWLERNVERFRHFSWRPV